MILKNFIVFEGIDGAGTSTQIKRIVEGNPDKYSFDADVAGEYTITVVADDLYGNQATKSVKINAQAAASKGGCGGSIIATSVLLSTISVLGVAAIACKKRKQK